MEATLKVLNKLVEAGIIERYAVGGAVGSFFWLEVAQTEDLDVFVVVPASASRLHPLQHVYDALTAQGYAFKGAHMMIEGVPVQFLAGDWPPILDKALGTAVSKPYETLEVLVVRPEYLIAIAFHAKRGKDYIRVAAFVEQVPDLDVGLVRSLVASYEETQEGAARFRELFPTEARTLLG